MRQVQTVFRFIRRPVSSIWNRFRGRATQDSPLAQGAPSNIRRVNWREIFSNFLSESISNLMMSDPEFLRIYYVYGLDKQGIELLYQNENFLSSDLRNSIFEKYKLPIALREHLMNDSEIRSYEIDLEVQRGDLRLIMVGSPREIKLCLENPNCENLIQELLDNSFNYSALVIAAIREQHLQEPLKQNLATRIIEVKKQYGI
ncbi:MAG: hypothetical protein SFU25_09155 [Candidatus Caenarcaniphilales bacterium]|nr:hypothetical protein [Candidatus Caenarcaniphilales bacterium]